jgi:hypothetical protein
MKTKKETVRRVVQMLNTANEDGGFWLPNIQRPFVWSEEQIYRLFDSIMREYPISTFLVWKSDARIRRRKFIDNWHERLSLSDFYVPEDSARKSLVLDGQQRLQSLYIGLHGSHEGRELYFDVLSGDVTAPDDIKYNFRFLATGTARFPWVSVKHLVNTSKRKRELVAEIRDAAGRPLAQEEENKIADHLDLVDRTLRIEEIISYQELDSIDYPSLYTEDDVVEIFIRANSGGTRLSKSDLLFSLLSSSWDSADDEMQDLLNELNRHGFQFTRDFVLKTALTLLDQGSRYEVEKFRRPGVRDSLEAQWRTICDAIKDVLDYVRGKTYVQCDKALPSYLVLIPLIYARCHFRESWRDVRDLDDYILRCSLSGAFSGNSDGLIDALVAGMKAREGFSRDQAFQIIRTQGRALEITEERLWKMGYGSDLVHVLFNLWYRTFNHVPAYENNLPQIDHIFPQSALRRVKTRNPKTGRDVIKYREHARNQLANCMLLTREENGAGGKRDKLPSEWFADKDVEYLQKHAIPQDPTLWTLEKYEQFVEARKSLIRERLSPYLAR